MRLSHFALLALPLLASCGGTGTSPVKSTPTKPAPDRLAVRTPMRHLPPPTAQVLAAPGLEGIIGANADELSRLFGTARLDVWEGDARKLQFIGTACVLDVYLYPKSAGDEPKATFLDARRTDGLEVNRAACVAALRKH